MGRNKKASVENKRKDSKIISLVKLGVKPDFDSLFKLAIKRIEKAEAYGMMMEAFGIWDEAYDDFWYDYASNQADNCGICGGFKPKQVAPGFGVVNKKIGSLRLDREGLLGGGSKRGSRGHKKSKKAKQKSLWEMGYFDELSVQNDSEKPVVYFYKDYTNPDDVECFMTLGEFDKFLQDEGIHVPENVSLVIMNNEECHCCINPNSSMMGEVTLMANSTYYGLKWDASIEDYDCGNTKAFANNVWPS